MAPEAEPGRPPRAAAAQEERVFEGGVQETVEVLPRVDALSPREREEGVVARVGRDRIDRRVQEGPAAATASAGSFNQERDDLMVATYTVATYYAMAIATILFLIALGWVVVSNKGL